MKKLLKNKIVICLLSGVVFMLFTMPPRKVLSVFTTSEVRPAVVLNTVLGISFGMPAAIGIAISNAIADYLTGYSWLTIAEGIIPQFIYTYLPYVLWNKLNKDEDHIHRLNSFARTIKYLFVVIIYAIVSALLCAIQVQLTFGANFYNVCFFVFLNNFTMALVLGCPLMVISNQHMARLYGNQRNLSLNEKVIIASSLCQVALISVIIFFVYKASAELGTLDIWNTIYVYAIVAVNVFMFITLILMKLIENNYQKKEI